MSSKHAYPFQSKQLDSMKYCKPQDFSGVGPTQIREQAFRKLQ